jgi:hypothetical protein
MNKRAKIHLLPTNDAEFNYAPVFKDVDGKTLVYNRKSENPDVFWKDCQYFHLYITTDDSIKIGDWYTDGVVVNQLQDDELPMSYDRKIIATTDPELKYPFMGFDTETGIDCSDVFPKIPQSFIEEYCRVGGIDEVDVEYNMIMGDEGIIAHAFGEDEYKLKVASNNEIIIHLIEKKMYSEDEVYKIAKVAYRMGAQNHNDATVERFDEWIKTFL